MKKTIFFKQHDSIKHVPDGPHVLTFSADLEMRMIHVPPIIGGISQAIVIICPVYCNSLDLNTVQEPGMFQGSHAPKLKDGVRLIIHRRLPKDSRIGNVTFSLDTDSRIFASVEYRYSLRKKRHSLDEYRINGKAVSFRMASPGEMKGSFDLVIVATKYSGLYEARDMIRTVVGPDTIIVSLLNGISSEKILAEVFEREQIIDCVAIGLDAVREGTSLTYQHMGRWQVGSVMKEQDKNLADLTQFLDTSGIEYEVCSDIRRAMWNKFIKQQRNPEPKPQKKPEQKPGKRPERKPGKKPRQKKQLKTML